MSKTPSLFIVERTPLADLDHAARVPVKGDTVVFLRDAQDLDGASATDLRSRGVRVIWGPELLDKSEIRDIEAFLNRYIKGWFVEDGKDLSKDGDLSLGQFLSGQLASMQKPPLIVVLGEICRKALVGMAPGGIVFCDIVDGWTLFANQVPAAEISPRRSLVKALALAAGQDYQDLPVSRTLPDIHRTDSRTGSVNPYVSLARSFVGGLRPSYLLPRLRAAFAKAQSPGVYIYFNHGLRLIGERLVEAGGLRVYGDRDNIPGVTPLRYDHLWAWPSKSLRAAARRLATRYKALVRAKENPVFIYKGFDYGPFLLPGIGILLKRNLPVDLIRMAQAVKLMKRFGIGLSVINGDTASMYAAMGYARANGHKIVYVDHGLNVFLHGLRNAFLNQSHVTYITHGTDHMDAYGIDLAAAEKPSRPLLGNPATVLMGAIRPLRGAPPRRRVLMANYTPHYANHCGRFHDYDRYMRDLLSAARTLIERGAHVTYRPHHGENPAYISHMIEAMGLTGQVVVDDGGTFEEALPSHDVFVANTTSCIYQALYAGWPTVFFDPGMDMDYLIGMPAATDIFRPTAQTPAQLVSMVEDAFDPTSKVARFPELFAGALAPRFVGPDADRSDQAIAEFIRQQLALPVDHEETRRVA